MGAEKRGVRGLGPEYWLEHLCCVVQVIQEIWTGLEGR